jgi:hypothetical protein
LVNATSDPASFQYQLDHKKSSESAYRKTLLVNEFPAVGTSNNTNGTSLAGGVALNMPSGIVAGDLLLAFTVNDNPGTTDMAISGWTQVFHEAYTSNVIKHACFAKIAVGSDTATLTGASQDYAATVLRIPVFNHGVGTIATDIKVATVAIGLSETPNPNDLDAGSSKKWLWLASNGSDDDDNNSTYWPTSYTGISQVESAQSTSSCMLQLAYRQLEAQSENPGTFALTAGQSEEWVAKVIAIPPFEERIVIAASANITASGENTTVQLTAPSGKTTGDFVAGRIQDDENPADTVDITIDDYTEMEWSLQATASAVDSEVYQFRVSKAGTALDTYSVTPEWTIGSAAGGNPWYAYSQQ